MILSTTRIIIFTVVFVSCCPQRQVHTATADPSEVDLVTRACDHTSYKDLCKSVVLESTPPSKSTKDMHDLVEVFLKAALANATDIYNYINELVNTKLDPFMEQCLLDCSDNYEDVMDQLDDSIMALDSRAYDDIDAWIKSVISDVESCEEGFTERRGYRSPLKARNKMFNQLGSIALSINKVLESEWMVMPLSLVMANTNF